MDTEGEDNIYKIAHTYECRFCFLCIRIGVDSLEEVEKEWACDYCKDKTMDDRELLERRLEVMGNANVRRFVETIRLMYKVFFRGKHG